MVDIVIDLPERYPSIPCVENVLVHLCELIVGMRKIFEQKGKPCNIWYKSGQLIPSKLSFIIGKERKKRDPLICTAMMSCPKQEVMLILLEEINSVTTIKLHVLVV